VGWLLPGESVTAAECTAAARAFSTCSHGGRIVTDCKAVLDMYKWLKKPAGKAAAAAGLLKQCCWEKLAAAVELRPDVLMSWMPSHRSKAEAMQLGIPEAWHIGNAKADELAKLAARMVDMPSDLLEQHLQHRAAAERVATTVAAIQLRRLQARTRTEDGGAVKERRRQPPGLPWRIRAQGKKRSRPLTARGAGAGLAAEQAIFCR
jgi:ribonuclease HI